MRLPRCRDTRKPHDVQTAPKYRPRDDGHSFEAWQLQFLQWLQVRFGLRHRIHGPSDLTNERDVIGFSSAVLIAMTSAPLDGDFKVQGILGDGIAIWNYLVDLAKGQSQWNCIDLRASLQSLAWPNTGTQRHRADVYCRKLFEIVHTLDLKGEPLPQHQVRDIIVQNLPAVFANIAPQLLSLEPLDIKNRILQHAGVLTRMKSATSDRAHHHDYALVVGELEPEPHDTTVFCEQCSTRHPLGAHTRDRCPACRRRQCERGDNCPWADFMKETISQAVRAGMARGGVPASSTISPALSARIDTLTAELFTQAYEHAVSADSASDSNSESSESEYSEDSDDEVSNSPHM